MLTPTAFPGSLGPFGLLPAYIEGVDLLPGESAYTIKQRPATKFKDVVRMLTGEHASRGDRSPIAPLPAGWPGAPASAAQVCWAYPMEGVAKLDALGALGFVNTSASPEQCFYAYGGFLLLDASGAVVAVQAVGAGAELGFSPPKPLPKAATTDCVARRLRPVTLPPLLRGGARQFCWIAPGEGLACGPTTWVPSKTGAFLYLCADGAPPIYFSLVLGTSRASRTLAWLGENGKVAAVAAAAVLAAGAAVRMAGKRSP